MFDCIKNLFLSFDPFYTVENKKDLYILKPKDERIPISCTLIFLHGLGDTGDGLIKTFQLTQRPVPDTTKVILPTAPIKKITLFEGQEMNAWFDFKGFTNETDLNEDEIKEMSKYVQNIIEEEVKNYDGNYSKIFLGGFSQGACLALYTGLNLKENLGGLVICSGLLFPFGTKDIDENKKKLPIYIAHGELDDVIPYQLAEFSYQYLLKNNYEGVKYNIFTNTGHWIPPEALPMIKDFIFMNNIKDII